MAALIAAAQLAPPEPVATVSYASAGRVLVIGSADRAERAAALLADRLDVSLLLPHAGGSAGAGADDARPHRQADANRGLARRLRGDVDARQPDRRRPLHALQRLHRGLPRAGDRLQLPDRPRQVHRPSRLRARLRRRRRDRLRARRRGAERALRSRPRPAGGAADRAAPAAAGLLPRRRRRRAVRRRAAPARQRRRVREAEVLRLQAEDLRAHEERPDRLHRVHRRLLGGGDPQRRADQGPDRQSAASSSSRTCASAAAPARRCARAAR